MKFTQLKTIGKSLIPFTFSIAISTAQTDDAVVVYGEYSEPTEQVSALKTSTPLIDVPQSVSVITADEIKEQGLNSVGDIVDYTPGVVNTQGEGHRDAVIFRGTRSTAAFFVDGQRDDVQYYRSLYNVDQVEVLTGANSLFFGRGNPGGAINRSTKKPLFDQDFTNYFGSVNSFGGTELQADYNKVIDEKTAVRFNAHVDHLANHRDFFYGDRIGLNPTVTHKFTDQTSVTFSYEYINNERFIDRGIPTIDDRAIATDLVDVVFGDSELNFSSLDAHTLKAVVDHDFDNGWTGKATISYGSYDKLYQNFYAADYDDAADTVTIDGYRDTTERDRFELSGDLLGEFTTGSVEHKLALGANFTYTSNDNDRYNTNFTPNNNNDSDTALFDASSFRLTNGVGAGINGEVVNDFNTSLNDDTHATITTYGFYIQDEIAINNYIDVVLGGRFDSFEIDVDNVKNPSESDSQRDTFFAPRAGLVIKPVENLSFYGSYSQTFLPNSGQQFANTSGSLDPDEFTNIEFGLKWNIQENLFFTASVFELTTSEADEDVNNNPIFVDSEATGIELALKGNITDAWSISAGYTYLENENEDGETRRESPEHSFSIWNNYQVNEKLAFGLGVIYQDESLTSDGSSTHLPSYVRVDAGVSYAFNESYSIGLHIENLFDTDYYPSSHSTHQVTVGAPINATLSVKGTF